MKHEEFYFECHHKQLFAQSWQPQQPKGVVVLVHGMFEHSGRYSDHVVPELTGIGLAVIGFDHFGHGHSDMPRGHCPSFQAVLDSVSAILLKAKELFKDLPVFLYGHSMGGNVVLNYAMRRHPDIRGLIVSSPMLRLAFEPPKWKVTAGKLLQRIYPGITMKSDLDVNAISRDEEEKKKYKNDHLVHDKVTPNYVFPFLKAGEWAISKSHTLKLPALLIHGKADRITDYRASVEFAREAAEVTLVLFEGGYHELHNDTDRKLVMKTICDWIESKL